VVVVNVMRLNGLYIVRIWDLRREMLEEVGLWVEEGERKYRCGFSYDWSRNMVEIEGLNSEEVGELINWVKGLRVRC